MPSALSFYFVFGVKRISNPFGRKLECLGRIDVFGERMLVVRYVCYAILLQLTRLRLVNITEIHVVAPFKLFVLAICISVGALNVPDIELIVIESICSFRFRNCWL